MISLFLWSREFFCLKHITLAKSSELEAPSVVGVINQSYLVFVMCFDYWIIGSPIFKQELIGAVVVIIGNSLYWISKNASKQLFVIRTASTLINCEFLSVSTYASIFAQSLLRSVETYLLESLFCIASFYFTNYRT